MIVFKHTLNKEKQDQFKYNECVIMHIFMKTFLSRVIFLADDQVYGYLNGFSEVNVTNYFTKHQFLGFKNEYWFFKIRKISAG